MSVVDIVGVNPSGQISSASPVCKTISDLFAKGLSFLPVIQIILI